MLNFKWGLVAGAAAFVISFVLGLISGVNIFNLILRAVLFMIVFFGFGVGLQILVNNFFPELLFNDSDTDWQDTPASSPAGSHVNITLDNSSGYAIPELYRKANDPEAVGNIEDLVSGVFQPGTRAIDQNEEDGYNYESGSGQSSSIGESFGFPDSASDEDTPPPSMPGFSPTFGEGSISDDTAGLGGLPDFEAMASIFSGGNSADPVQSFEGGEPVGIEGPRRPKSGKAQPLKGDFNPKELAEGIRTVLSKDK